MHDGRGHRGPPKAGSHRITRSGCGVAIGPMTIAPRRRPPCPLRGENGDSAFPRLVKCTTRRPPAGGRAMKSRSQAVADAPPAYSPTEIGSADRGGSGIQCWMPGVTFRESTSRCPRSICTWMRASGIGCHASRARQRWVQSNSSWASGRSYTALNLVGHLQR
jgi:hypothetical protein